MARFIRTLAVSSLVGLLISTSAHDMFATGGVRPSVTTVRISPEHTTRDGDEVTISAVVAPLVDTDGVPGGVVEFFDGMTSLGSTSLALERGRLTGTVTWAPRAGSHTITARYAGDAIFASSASLPVLHAVAAR